MNPEPKSAAVGERPASRRSRRRLQPAHEARARRRRLLGWCLFGAACVLLVNALVGDKGYLATLRAERDYAALEASLARIRLDNQQLRYDIDRMRNDPTALEEAARGGQGLIKPGETLVIIRDAPKDPPAGSGSR